MKYFKKILCILLLFCLVIPFTPSIPVDAAVRLNEITLNMKVNDQFQLKVLGKHSRPSWSSTNSNIAMVNSKGKVVARKKGTATIKCKIKNKTYKCKVIVKKIPIVDYSKKISYESYETDDSFVFIVHNSHTAAVLLTANLRMVDKDGNNSFQSYKQEIEIGKNCNSVLCFMKPYDYYQNENYYASYDLQFKATNISKYLISTQDKITCEYTIGADNTVTCDICNTGKRTTHYYQVTCLYYKGSKLVAANSKSSRNLYGDSTSTITFEAPEDSLLNKLSFDRVKVNIDTAIYQEKHY